EAWLAISGRSSHYQEWLARKQYVDLLQSGGSEISLTEEEYQKLMVFFANFYSGNWRGKTCSFSMLRYSLPALILGCCAPLPCLGLPRLKEFGVLSRQRPIAMECEFLMLEVLDALSVVIIPYRSLGNCLLRICKTQGFLRLVQSLRTDACLHYPPYLIALAGIHIACLVCGKDAQAWFVTELSVDLDKVLEIVAAPASEPVRAVEGLRRSGTRCRLFMEKMPRPEAGI
uniref:Rab-GAP TBC domain-containing protein n=1 Tax=Macrostomum lignano TaxID=282301 RepID=A0A1I8FRL1_9PLAT